MNPILLDFEKLFATIKNDKNNIQHLPYINNMIDNFENKYNDKYAISIHLLVLYLRKMYQELEKRITHFA